VNGRLRDPSLLILCYHAVSERWPWVGTVEPDVLSRQLRYALELGYRPRTLTAALREPAGTPTLVVSFDDAFASVLERGLPVLEDLGVPGTVFVPTEFAAEAAPMTWSTLARWIGTEHEPELLCMGWDQLRRLADAGWEVGSHTCSHPNLTAIGALDAAEELRRSRRACEDALQRSCPALAYPFGARDRTVVGLAEDAGYEVGVTLGERLWEALAAPSPLELARDGVYRSTRAARFRLAVSPALRRLRTSRVWTRLTVADRI
jgi:peptidoglycan/xylan/chitin deacetylase (PgdA/CDA1 family)